MTKRTYPLDSFGYVTTWLISGRLDTPVDTSTRPKGLGQWQYEEQQKRTIHDNDLKNAPECIEFETPGINSELPWRFYAAGNNSFVDVSLFYPTIYRCEFWVATSIVSPCDREVEADIWNYPSYDAWLGGEHISADEICHYAPMKRNRVTLSLKKGENVFFLRAQNACTRDTRHHVALQIIGNTDITVTYPGKKNEKLEAIREAFDWIYSVYWNGEKLVAPTPTPDGTEITLNGEKISGSEFDIPANAREAKLTVKMSGLSEERKIEITERFVPEPKITWNSPEEARTEFLKTLSERYVDDNCKDSHHFFTTYARLMHGLPLTENDLRVTRLALVDCDLHKDCSDFRFSYILAAVKRGLLPDYLVEEIHKTALSYCYWEDEATIGALCQGTENHSLLFHSCQLLAGELWPDDVFERSGRTGREQAKLAEQRIASWAEKREKNGFTEFLSGGYTPITVAGMILVIDFANETLSARYSKLLNQVFYEIAYNTFDGVVCAPQGRIYRGVIRPWDEGTQMLSYFSTGTTHQKGRYQRANWLTAFKDTKYKFPTDIEEHIHNKGMHYTKVEGTVIHTFKGDHFMLTSLPLELKNGECFGKYVPGRIGYQQHLSYASLGGACIVFPTHPGLPCDAASIRPGYWFGNGFFPAQKQWDNVIGQVFPLCDEHPIKFTHLYFPTRCFDETAQEGSWLFGRRGEGYIGVWCSNKLSLFDGDIVQGCDYRAEAGACAYLTVCGDSVMNGSFEEFKKYAKDFKPELDRETLTLTTSKGQSIGGEFVGLDDPTKFRTTF